MTRLLLCFWLFATLLPGADEKGKPEKEPEALVEEFHVRREDQRILMDGVVIANRTEPLKGMMVKFELLAPGEQLISWQEAKISEEMLEAGDDVSFYLQCADHVRAVSVRVEVRDGRNMVLRTDKPGPYPIQ